LNARRLILVADFKKGSFLFNFNIEVEDVYIGVVK
jgi:hypothetical protein